MTSRSLSSRLPLNSSTVFKLHQNRLPSTSFCLSTGAPTPVSSIATLLFSTAPPIPEKELIVNGFLRSVRKQKHLAFGALADGSTMTPLQVVMSPEQAHSLSTGAAVRIKGRWVPSPKGKEQSHELHASQVELLGEADPATYPLQKKYHTKDYLRTMPHLRIRTPFNALLLHLRSYAILRLTRFFARRDFVQAHPPVISSSDAEGAGQVFTVTTDSSRSTTTEEDGSKKEFFRSPKYLTVSSQLHLEALAQSVGKVWALAPTFRAEGSDTSRHLSEFYMLEVEMSFVDNLEGVMGLIEDMLRDLIVGLRQSLVGRELLQANRDGKDGEEGEGVSSMAEQLTKRWEGLESKDWPRIRYSQAIRRLKDAVVEDGVEFEHAPSWASGLQAEHERWIAEHYGDGCRPVFVTNYPLHLKPFYMKPAHPVSASNPFCSTAACFDLIMPGVCEVAGGSLREHRLEELLTSMKKRHRMVRDATRKAMKGSAGSSVTSTNTTDDSPSTTNQDQSEAERDAAVAAAAAEAEGLGNLAWYVDLRRWGSVPHGGFGLGFDRLLAYIAGVSNVKEMVTFPRWEGRCDC